MDLDMGKYAFYVWGAYGLSFLALAALTAFSLRAHAKAKRTLEALTAALNERVPAKPEATPAGNTPE